MSNPNTDQNPYDIPAGKINSEIKQAIQELGALCKGGEPTPVPTVANYRNGRLLVLLGRQADEQTRRIVRLTYVLAALTLALVFTAGLQTWYMYRDDERKQHEKHIQNASRTLSPSATRSFAARSATPWHVCSIMTNLHSDELRPFSSGNIS